MSILKILRDDLSGTVTRLEVERMKGRGSAPSSRPGSAPLLRKPPKEAFSSPRGQAGKIPYFLLLHVRELRLSSSPAFTEYSIHTFIEVCDRAHDSRLVLSDPVLGPRLSLQRDCEWIWSPLRYKV